MDNELKKQQKTNKLASWSISKETLACDWLRKTEKEKNIKFKQGQVVMCEIGENIGYEICNVRPSIVISDGRYSSMGQLTIIPLTKNISKNLKTHYTLIESKYPFLSFDSCVKTEQIKSVSSTRMNKILGQIDKEDLKKIKVRLKSLFNI